MWQGLWATQQWTGQNIDAAETDSNLVTIFSHGSQSMKVKTTALIAINYHRRQQLTSTGRLLGEL
jgi:hypothetical protein